MMPKWAINIPRLAVVPQGHFSSSHHDRCGESSRFLQRLAQLARIFPTRLGHVRLSATTAAGDLCCLADPVARF